MEAPIICVIGKRGSGKTKLIEMLVRDLSSKGLKVSVFKHIHHDDFEIDIEGKDTWRYAQAGASNIIGISKSKMFIVQYLDNYPDIIKLVDTFKKSSDIIFLEGFKYNLGKNRDIYKLIVAREEHDVIELMDEISEPIIGVYSDNPEIKSSQIIDYNTLKSKIIKLIS